MKWNKRNLVRWAVSTLLVVSLLLTLGMPTVNAAEQGIFEYDSVPAEHPLFVPGEILVKFQTGIPDLTKCYSYVRVTTSFFGLIDARG